MFSIKMSSNKRISVVLNSNRYVGSKMNFWHGQTDCVQSFGCCENTSSRYIEAGAVGTALQKDLLVEGNNDRISEVAGTVFNPNYALSRISANISTTNQRCCTCQDC